jgi:4-amino-4-deoxy-L-arabinose transferase-like glycosyltransferase
LKSEPDFTLHSRVRFKADLLLLFVLSIVIVSLWIPMWAGPLDLRWDAGVYYVLGTSIAEGKGYRLLNEPGEIEAIQYPPLLPLLATVPQAVLGTNDPAIAGRWLKLFFFLIYVILAFAFYFMLRIFFPRWLSFLGVLAFLLNGQTTFHSNIFMTEIPFALVTVLFVLCNRRSSSRVHETLAAVFAVTAFLLRTAGVTLFTAWVVESLAKKQFKRAAVRLLISGIPVLSWQAYVSHVERSPSYMAPAYPYQRAPYLNYNVSYATNLSLVDAYSPPFGSKATPRQLANRFWQNFLGVGVTLGEAVSDSRDYWKTRLNFRFRGQRFPFLKTTSQWLFYIPLSLLGGLILGE